MLKNYIIGVVVLITAIIANGLANKFQVLSWYGFLSKLIENPSHTMSELKFFDALFLFLLYPLILGFSASFGLYISGKIVGKR